MRKSSHHHVVFSSSWSRRKQAEMLDEWQIMALGAQIAANQLRYRIINGVSQSETNRGQSIRYR